MGIEIARPKTAADYAAIAVAPVLIFLMISSLANFLMLVLYHGGQPQRVAWTLAFFTMGTVAIARLSIEQSRAYSLGYASILGIVALIAMLRFVNSPVFSAFILILIGYLSDRIVHDCTLIDDSVDASGQGLIDSGRLFVKEQMAAPGTPDASPTEDTAVKPAAANAGNQPGRTVMYLALGALPLFGFGQFLLRQDGATWQRAQWLLALYLFSSLSLLVTTSFLGLRRYLRQRKVDMPKDVSVAWLGGGLALIAAILFIAYVAPMPGAALASFELPNILDSPGDTTASRFGWGDEAADKNAPDAAATRNDPNQDDKEVGSVRPEEGAPQGDVGDGKRKDGPAGKQKGGEKPSGGGSDPGESKSEEQSQSKQSGESGEQKGQQKSEGSEKGGEQGEQKGGEEGGKQGDESSESSESSQDEGKANDSAESDSQKGEQGEKAGETSQQQQAREQEAESNQRESSDSATTDESDSGNSSDSGVSDMISNVIPAMSGIVRFLIFLVLAAIVFGYLWIHRDAIAAWWQNLFGGGRGQEKEDSFEEFLRAETQVPPRAFATYRNPFGSEKDPRRIVVITFQAFEAWTREQGSTRGKDETPSEFIRRIARSLPQLSAPASQVVDSYNRIAYGRGGASERDLAAARKVWHAMQA